MSDLELREEVVDDNQVENEIFCVKSERYLQQNSVGLTNQN